MSVSIPFSAGQRVKDCPDKIDPMRYNWKFLSLFQQGKELKMRTGKGWSDRYTDLVSIPFSAGQRVKEGAKLLAEPMAPYCFYPFFSRAKS